MKNKIKNFIVYFISIILICLVKESRKMKRNGEYLYFTQDNIIFLYDFFVLRGNSVKIVIWLVLFVHFKNFIHALVKWKRLRKWEKRHQK